MMSTRARPWTRRVPVALLLLSFLAAQVVGAQVGAGRPLPTAPAAVEPDVVAASPDDDDLRRPVSSPVDPDLLPAAARTPAVPADDEPVGDAPEQLSPIPVGSEPIPATPGPASPPRQMSTAETAAWTAARAAASAAGSTLGAAAGAVALPAVVTAIVGALGISTAGTGFVGAVLIPAMPVVGKILGSALGSALFSSVVAVAYEVRMNRFRPVPKTAQEIAREVAKSAALEAVAGALTGGLGGGAATAAGQSLKTTLTEILKKAAIRFAGQTAIQVLVKRLPGMPAPGGGGMDPLPPMEAAPPDEPAIAPPASSPATATPVVSGPQGYNPLANSRPQALVGEYGAGAADEGMQEEGASYADSGPGDTEPARGFSAHVEKTARTGMIIEPLAAAAACLPRHLGAALGLRMTISVCLYKML
ncbi:MAG: hypothetical protein GX442_26130 [Candidatus Riflebacteria bacterium]|nr:hypothetical protein [Candidatus Riflebacteria bacterium]